MQVAGKNDFDQVYYHFKNGGDLTKLKDKRRYCASNEELESLVSQGKISTLDRNFILNTPSACIGANHFISAATDYQLLTKNARISKVKDVSGKVKSLDDGVLDEAKNFGWMTAGIYYGKLSSQGGGASSLSLIHI